MTWISSAVKTAICPVAKLVPSAERFFIQSEGFGQNLEWALNLDLISKRLIQELKRNENLTFTQIVNDMGKKYGDFYRKHKISEHNDLKLDKKSLKAFGKAKIRIGKHLHCFPLPHLHFLFESSDDPLHTLIYKFYGRRCEFLYKRKGIEFKNVYKGKVISEHSNSLNFYFMDDSRIKGATVESLTNFKEMRKEFNLLFKAYRQEKNSSEVIDVVAEIHWLFANVAPYVRGSAAIGDAICRALLEAKGIRTSRWKAKIIPDCEALTLPLEKFKKRYASFFENELKETFNHVG